MELAQDRVQWWAVLLAVLNLRVLLLELVKDEDEEKFIDSMHFSGTGFGNLD
jgi:hypothetical protein